MKTSKRRVPGVADDTEANARRSSAPVACVCLAALLAAGPGCGAEGTLNQDGVTAQRAPLAHTGFAPVQLRSETFGRCLNLQASDNGTKPNVWSCAHHPDQVWELIYLDSGYVKIENKARRKCLNLQWANRNDGGYPNVWSCATHPDQEWELIYGGPAGSVKIRNRQWGKCLTLLDNYDGGKPRVWDCKGGPLQDWKLDPVYAPSNTADLEAKDWCYRHSGSTITFYPIIANNSGAELRSSGTGAYVIGVWAGAVYHWEYAELAPWPHWSLPRGEQRLGSGIEVPYHARNTYSEPGDWTLYHPGDTTSGNNHLDTPMFTYTGAELLTTLAHKACPAR